MADFNTIFHILEGDYSVANLVWAVTGRKNVFEDLYYSFSKSCREAFKYQMRIRLGDCTSRGIWDVRSQNDVMQGERGGRTMGEMGDGHGSRGASMFMEEDDIGEGGSLCAGEQIGEDEVASIQSDRSRQKQTDLFRES